MYDPPRPEAKSAVAACHNAGIRVVMITGDHPNTALAIARELGVASSEKELLTGFELQRISDEELGRRVSAISVFARVTAEHKLRIVRAWKAKGAVVAMTGDGVNDAPALKGADIGIAMGRSGTEVTKQASDMVITDDNFASIVAAIEEGRGIYANIRKTLQYLLATNAGELLFITLCLSFGMPLPLLPVQLLWINLVTDGLPALILVTGALEKDLLQRPPRPVSARIADHQFLFTVILTGVAIALTAWLVYAFALRAETELVARTYAVATIIFSQLFCAFSFLSETQPIWRARTLGNVRLAGVIIGTLLLQIALFRFSATTSFFKTSILPFQICLWLVLVSLSPLAILEIAKIWRRGGSKVRPVE
jgi:Ca2+-transporting ATPase